MKIATNNHPINLNFKSLSYNHVQYIDSKGIQRTTQNSTGMRKDLDYDELATLIKQRFPDSKKIRIMPMNVSDGTEAYLIANSILKIFGKEKAKEKIFPIHASDISSYIIDNFGKRGVVALTDDEKQLFGKNFDKFFKETSFDKLPKENYPKDAKAYELTPEFKKYFNFYSTDFQKRLNLLCDEGNSVVIIRNCLAQSFKFYELPNIIFPLGDRLKQGSLFVIGDYDRKNSSLLEFLDSDFKEVGMNIFGLKNYTPTETSTSQKNLKKDTFEQEHVIKSSQISILTKINNFIKGIFK